MLTRCKNLSDCLKNLKNTTGDYFILPHPVVHDYTLSIQWKHYNNVERIDRHFATLITGLYLAWEVWEIWSPAWNGWPYRKVQSSWWWGRSYLMRAHILPDNWKDSDRWAALQTWPNASLFYHKRILLKKLLQFIYKFIHKSKPAKITKTKSQNLPFPLTWEPPLA